MKIQNNLSGCIGAYAQKELKNHLFRLFGKLPEITFVLQTAPDMEEYAYGYTVEGSTVLLSGKRENEVLLAVYLLLDKLGITFDTTTHYPQKPNLSALESSETVHPFVRLRGIRQHINFLMDISSYHLEDAKEYIRSLARMRMNAITFHSYDGMWHNSPGHFFYGRIQTVPKELLSVVDNRAYYMIPECEAIYANESARGEYAVFFLNELIQTARECGMHVTLSIEPAAEFAVTAQALSYYPQIDMLELITPEGGGVFEPETTDAASIKAHAVKLFGRKILKNGILPGLDEQIEKHSAAIVPTLYSLKRAMEHAAQVDAVPVRIGLYVLCTETLYIVKRIMDKVLPKERIKTFLPAHGAEAVKDTVQFMEFSPSDFQTTVLHSWIEFDGNMYIAQNAANSLDRTVSLLKAYTQADSIHAMYFNHWRTEENRIPIAYAAAVTEAPLPVCDWYKTYAAKCGISDTDAFAELLYEAGELDIYCRDNLFNIGFCFLPCWTAHFGNGWIKDFTPDKLSVVMERMQKLCAGFDDLLQNVENKDGITLLRLLQNRYHASICHLHVIADMNRSLLEGEAALKEAQRSIQSYLLVYSEMLPDRGSQGLLVDYANAMPRYIDHLRASYFGGEVIKPEEDTTLAPPPAPV